MSLLSSLADSGLDVLGLADHVLCAVRVSLKPADHEHRFGHGKAEGLAALAQSADHRGLGRITFCGRRVARILIAPADIEQNAPTWASP